MRWNFARKTVMLGLAVCLIMGLPLLCHAEAKKISRGIFEVDGYKVDASGHQQGDDICLRGRVTFGPDCDRLRMKFRMVNQVGHTQTVTTIVEDVGGSGSRTIREDVKCKKEIKKVRPKWVIEDISVTCLD